MAKIKIEKVDCQGERCEATWHWVDRPAGHVRYNLPSNGLRGSKHLPAINTVVQAYTSDDYLWLFECPFCGYAESDQIVPED